MGHDPWNDSSITIGYSHNIVLGFHWVSLYVLFHIFHGVHNNFDIVDGI